jgi:prepilin-type N-terminal cleavage/methylation domain-containing protein
LAAAAMLGDSAFQSCWRRTPTSILPLSTWGGGKGDCPDIQARFNRPKAFTLVEVLVVIAIIVVLMGLLVPALSNARKKAAVATQKMDFQVIGSAMEQYKSDFNVYPLNSGFTLGTRGQYSIGPLAAALLGPGPAATDANNHNGDGADGAGFRTLLSQRASAKIYGPYLQVDKFAVVWLPNGNGSILVPYILDHWGNPIEYFPVYNSATTVGGYLFGYACSGGSPQAMFDTRDGLNTNQYPCILASQGTINALLFKLGDANLNGKIDGAETLAPFSGYLLISPGPDGIFTNLNNAGSTDPQTYINKSDDVYNFEN